jgi:hypothetical protein
MLHNITVYKNIKLFKSTAVMIVGAVELLKQMAPR